MVARISHGRWRWLAESAGAAHRPTHGAKTKVVKSIVGEVMTQKQFWALIWGFGGFLAANIVVWLIYGAIVIYRGQ